MSGAKKRAWMSQALHYVAAGRVKCAEFCRRHLLMKNRIILIDHHDNLPDDRVTTHLAARGFHIDLRRPVDGELLDAEPGDDVAGSVVFGGAQNVDEMHKYPFLRDEIAWIRACHARALPLLGICLGGQLVAQALGGAVSALPGGRCEFGYYRITPTAAGRAWMARPLYAAQAHFYRFTPPPDATLLATGEGGGDDAQAFQCGASTFAVQFHPEVTRAMFRRWQDAEWAFFDSPGAQTREQQDALAAQHDAAQGAWFDGFLARLFAGPAD